MGYNLPKTLLRRTPVTNVNIYVRGTNLFLFGQDKNIPFDPEQGITNVADFNVYIPKSITFGINLAL